MEGLERALKATQRLLEGSPCHNTTMDPPTWKIRWPFDFLVRDLEDKIYRCQQDNERAFKLLWNLYVISQQRIDWQTDIGDTQDRYHFRQALDDFHHGFHANPFAVSPEGDSRVSPLTFDVLNKDNVAATRYEELARRIGKAWAEDRVPKYNAQVKDLGALQTSLFELLWSRTLGQLKRHSAYSAGETKRPEFEGSLTEVEKMLQDAIVRSRKNSFTIAFCGLAKAGKSMFLNALMGRMILPSDGEAKGSRAIIILTITTELPSPACPCRLRHVEGQTVPELHFQPDPFLAALKELQVHQYGQKMKTYKPPTENM